MTGSTPWLRIFLLIGAGAAVALQIGKVPPALPALRADLGISLVTAGWVVSIFSLIAAFGAVFLGGIADRFGPLKTALAGMLLCASASLVGAFSENESALLVTRLFEGLGFIATSVSIPALITRVAAGKDLETALAMWGSYVPAGSGVMSLVAGPLLLFVGWQGVWVAASLLVLFVAVLLWRMSDQIPVALEEIDERPGICGLFMVLRAPGPLLLSLIFVFYAAQYLTIASFLPLILVDLHGYRQESAAIVIALVVLGNAVGNLSAGMILRLGTKPLLLVLTGCAAMSIGGALVFFQESSDIARIIGAALSSTVGGMIPATLFTQVPQQAPSQRQLSSINGMLVQGAAIGQLLGPPACAYLVSRLDTWSAAIPALSGAALIAAIAAFTLNRHDTRSA